MTCSGSSSVTITVRYGDGRPRWRAGGTWRIGAEVAAGGAARVLDYWDRPVVNQPSVLLFRVMRWFCTSWKPAAVRRADTSPSLS